MIKIIKTSIYVILQERSTFSTPHKLVWSQGRVQSPKLLKAQLTLSHLDIPDKFQVNLHNLLNSNV